MLFIIFYAKLDFHRVLSHTCEDEYLSSLSLDSDAAAGLAGSVTHSVVAELKQLYTRSLTENVYMTVSYWNQKVQSS